MIFWFRSLVFVFVLGVVVVGEGVGVSPAVAATVSLSPTSGNSGDALTISWTGGVNATDWIAFYATGSSGSSYISYVYTNCSTSAPGSVVASGSCSTVFPASAGTYFAFFYSNNTYSVIATSNTVTQPLISGTVTPIDVDCGQFNWLVLSNLDSSPAILSVAALTYGGIVVPAMTTVVLPCSGAREFTFTLVSTGFDATVGYYVDANIAVYFFRLLMGLAGILCAGLVAWAFIRG